MKKRLLSGLLVVSMILQLFTLAVYANTETSGKCGENVTWSYSDGTLRIEGTGPMEGYSMPWVHLDGKIDYVVIEKGVTTVGANAFRGMHIRRVIIPEGVTHIGYGAFYGCGLLGEAALPSTLVEIGSMAFYDTAISVVNIPEGVKRINKSAFYYCKNITELTIPDSVKVIGESAFYNTYNLKRVYLSDKITEIGNCAFATLSVDMSAPEKQRVLDVYAPEGSVAYKWASDEKYNNAIASTRGEYVLKFGKSNPSDWAIEEIVAAINENLITNKVIEDYQKDITREEFCELVVKLYERFSGNKAENGKEVFNDTDNPEVLKAYHLGIVKGVSADRFAPNDKITRQELCVMLTRCIDIAFEEEDVSSFDTYNFADGDQIDDWAIDSINYAYSNGIIKGVGGDKVEPLGNTTREQAVLMIVRGFNGYENLIPEKPYADVENYMDFNDETTLFVEETAQEINDSIQSIHTSEDGYVMVISDDTQFDTLKKDDVFFLEGGEGTPFGEPFIGKIGHITDNGDSLSVNLVEPEINEVFDELSMNMSEKIDIAESENVHLVEGLTSDITTSSSKSFGVAGLSDVSDKTDDSGLSLTGTIDLLKLFNLKEKTPITPTVYFLNDGEAFHLSHCQYIRGRLAECYSCYITDVSNNELTGKKSACRKCLPNFKINEPAMEQFNGYERLTLDLELSLQNLYTDFVFEYDETGIKTLAGGVSGDVEFETVLNTEFGGKIEKVTTERRILGNNLKVTGLQEKSIPIFYFSCSPTGPVSFGVGKSGMDNFRFIQEYNPISVALVGYVDFNGNISVSGSAGFSYKKHIEFTASIIDSYKPCFSPDLEMSEGEWSFPINVSAQGDLNVQGAVSVMVYIFNINVAELAIFKLENNATGKVGLACQYGSSGTLPPRFTVDGYMEGLLKFFEVSLNLKIKYDLLFVDGEVGFSYKNALLTKRLYEIGIPNDTSYDKEVMGVNSCTAYDEKYYYFKDNNGNIVKKSKTDSSDVKLIYADDFYSICAIDKSYLYILKKNGNKFFMNRINKNDFVERQLLDNVTMVFFQDENYIYFTDDFSKNTIQKLDRKELTTSDFAKFDDEVIFVSTYGSREDNQYYVVTYKPDFFSDIFGDYQNYSYVINAEGKILKNFGEVDNLEECQILNFEDYSVAACVRGNGLTSWYAQYLYWISKYRDDSKQIGTIGGWRYDEQGIFTISHNDSGASKYVLKVHTPIGNEKEILSINSDQVFQAIHFTTITDYNSKGEKSEKEIMYCIDEIDGTWTLYEISSDFKKHKKVTTIPTNVSLSNCGASILGDTIYIYSVDEKGKESALIGTYEY